jgi:hypothetical protein
MTTRAIELETIATDTEGREVATELRFLNGGANYLAGNVTSKGYYLVARVQTRQASGFINWAPSETVETLIEAAARFSAGHLRTLASTIKGLSKYKAAVKFTATRAGLNLA